MNGTKSKKLSVLGKRMSMGDCVATHIEREAAWSKWKDNKCPNFERPPTEKVKERKRDVKRAEKLIGNPIGIQAREKEANWSKNG
jgi:hypothetical protein